MLKVKLFITMVCNLQCTYCYEKNKKQCMEHQNINYDLDDLHRLIANRLDMLNDNEVLIEFYGGEPLLDFEKIKIITEHMKNLPGNIKVNYAITTNGTLITPEISGFLEINSVKIFLSLDGDEDSTNNRIYISGKPAFSDILNGLRMLQKNSNNITINMVVNSNNFSKLIDNLQFLMKHSLRTFSIAIDFFDKKWLQISDDILFNFYKEVKEFCLSNDDVYVDSFEKKTFPLTQCTMAETLSVMPNGEVFPCTYFPTSCNGNLTLGHISQRLNWSILEEISKEVVCEDKQCPSYHGNCNIGCYGKNVTCTGDLYTPSPIICKHLRCSNDAISNYKFMKLRRSLKGSKTVTR